MLCDAPPYSVVLRSDPYYSGVLRYDPRCSRCDPLIRQCSVCDPLLRWPVAALVTVFLDALNFAIRNSWLRQLISFQKQPLEVFYKKAVLKHLTIFTEKNLCWILFLTKLQTSRPPTIWKKESHTGIFLWILRNF